MTRPLDLTRLVGPPVDRPGCAGCAPLRSDSVFVAAAVEQTVEIVSQPTPRYPPMLVAARISGRAVVRFIVDTAGVVEVGSIVVIEADHAAFGASAVETIARSRFRPARVGGRAVRQLVVQPVRFRLD